MKSQKAIHCRKVITLSGEGPSRGRDLFAPLVTLDNVVIISVNNVIESIEPFRGRAAYHGMDWVDMGDATLCPAFVNAHCHLQLSHLRGQTLLGQGFMPWLKSLVPLLRQPMREEELSLALEEMRAGGTAFVADYTGPALPAVAGPLAEKGLEALFLYECFGFSKENWLTDGTIKVPQIFSGYNCALAGHALYSTSENILRGARAWCAANGKPFAIHLAESPEEVETLTTGQGVMADFFKEKGIYPDNWSAPGLVPVRQAHKLGLLGAGTLAVHAVQCSEEDTALLAAEGTAICLCPRSNAAIGVGVAPVADFIDAGLLLCLGTDSLASNYSLDITQEAFFLRDNADLPPQALLRMLSVNGAAALGVRHLGTLEPGRACRLTSYPF